MAPSYGGSAPGSNRKMNLVTLAEPILQKHASQINETIYLFSWAENQLVFERAAESSYPLRYILELGVPYDLYRGAAGKVVLAHLPEEEMREILGRGKGSRIDFRSLKQKIREVQERGFSFTVGERVKGIIGFAAPIFGADHSFWGGATLAIPEVRYIPARFKDYAALTQKCAGEISAILNP